MEARQLRNVFPYVLLFNLLMQIAPLDWSYVVTSIQSDEEMNIGYSIIELVPYPEFSESPNFTIEGDSGEFSWDYSEFPSISHANLTWSHVAGTVLDFRGPPFTTDDIPDCNDFAYLSQSFNWSSPSLPGGTNLTIEYLVELTGDFADSENGSLMFNVYVWLIDSSAEWYQYYRSISPYSTELKNSSFSISYSEVETIWGGLIDDQDKVEIAIGLSPSRNFESTAWNEYNGTVTLMTTGMSLLVAAESEPPDLEPPLHTGTWDLGKGISSIYDLEVAHNGFVYTIGDVFITNDEYGSFESPLVIAKWDPQANLVWNKTWNPPASVESVINIGFTTHETGLYVVGEAMKENIVDLDNQRDLFLGKWDLDGNKIWSTLWDPGAEEYGAYDIAIAGDGSIYTSVMKFSNGSDYETFLLKFDSGGTLIWYQILGDCWPPELRITDDGTLLTLLVNETWWGMIAWDEEGNRLWTSPLEIYQMELLDSGSLYTLGPIGRVYPKRDLVLSKINGTLSLQWKYTISLENTSWWDPQFWNYYIVPGPQESVYLYIKTKYPNPMTSDYHSRLEEEYLLKFDSSGVLLWIRNFNNSYDLFDIGDNGMIYLCNDWPLPNNTMTLWVVPNPYYSPPIMDPIVLIVISGGAVLLVVIVIRFLRRGET
jgi:hypothetical protein